MFELILRHLTWSTSSWEFWNLEETNVRALESLAKEKNLSTVCDVVEISSKALKATNVRDPEFLAKEKYLITVCDVVEISSKALKETIVRVRGVPEAEYLNQKGTDNGF